MDRIRLFARLIVLELRHVFPALVVMCIARTADKIGEVGTLVLNQKDLPQTHRTQRQIAREVGISQRSVNHIVKKDLRLICMKKRRAHELTVANKQARLYYSHLLLRRYSASLVHFIWFTDEKLFTVALYSSWNSKERYYSRPSFTHTSDV